MGKLGVSHGLYVYRLDPKFIELTADVFGQFLL